MTPTSNPKPLFKLKKFSHVFFKVVIWQYQNCMLKNICRLSLTLLPFEGGPSALKMNSEKSQIFWLFLILIFSWFNMTNLKKLFFCFLQWFLPAYFKPRLNFLLLTSRSSSSNILEGLSDILSIISFKTRTSLYLNERVQ